MVRGLVPGSENEQRLANRSTASNCAFESTFLDPIFNQMLERAADSAKEKASSVGVKLCNNHGMRFIFALISGAAVLTAGCNSKPSQPEATEEPAAPAESRDHTKPGFRSRSASLPEASNEIAAARTPVPSAKKRSALPRPLIQQNPAAAQDEPSPATDDPSDAAAENVRPEDIPQEGDEILIPPKMLGKLIPGANFESVQREEPINVKSLLDQRGIVLTNYQQLAEMGITNYQIVRAQRPAEATDEK